MSMHLNSWIERYNLAGLVRCLENLFGQFIQSRFRYVPQLPYIQVYMDCIQISPCVIDTWIPTDVSEQVRALFFPRALVVVPSMNAFIVCRSAEGTEWQWRGLTISRPDLYPLSFFLLFSSLSFHSSFFYDSAFSPQLLKWWHQTWCVLGKSAFSSRHRVPSHFFYLGKTARLL